ncbi:MAG: DNA double-strand break repair nuclease NurA [Firmicutes bacterium]|nr:DNA double-strand break repair nuclease NurA [Bacillota bacterium]
MENQTVFSQLPEALVDEMLLKSEKIGEELFNSFMKLQKNKEEIRKQLKDKGILKNDSDFGYPGIPTTCGVDGSYVVERLLSTDLIACAAVAIEGLAPPSETRYWQKPNHLVFISPERHNPSSGTVIRGIMMGMEFNLAVKAPHDVVMLDGSLTTPLIYMNQALNSLPDYGNGHLSEKLTNEFKEFLISYKTIIEAPRTDKLWVGLPKYTTRRELGEKFGWPSYYDDRAILTSLLLPGEFTVPIRLEKPEQPWHLKVPLKDNELTKLRDEVLTGINRLCVVYYRPHRWTPALRIEMAYSIATNRSRLAILFQGLKYQSSTAGIMEPYPLYLADRMVKHLGSAIPAFRQTATRRMTELYSGDISEIFFNMHGYRTERGK